MRMWGLVQSIDGQFVLSATDVVGFAECPHRTARFSLGRGWSTKLGS